MTSFTIHNIENKMSGFVVDSNGDVIGMVRKREFSKIEGSHKIDLVITLALDRLPEDIPTEVIENIPTGRKIKLE